VGKTSAAINLAYLAALEGKKTLLWDLDLQGSATYLLGLPAPERKSLKVFHGGKSAVKKRLQPTPYKNLDILPADFSLHELNRHLDKAQKPTIQLRKRLESLRKKYDHIIIDSPSGYSMLSKNVIRAIDLLLIPVLPNALAMDTFETLRKQVKEDSAEDLLVFPFFSMVDRRKQLHREVTGLHVNGTRGFLHASIPYSSKIEQMATEQAPLATFDTRSAAAKAYNALWNEIKTNVGMYERVKQIKMW
jgi:cellulose biosynthesis protein BcsQ